LYLPPKAVDKRIGKELGVGYVVEGSVRKDGDKLRIVSQFIETKNGEHVWAERFDRAGADPWATWWQPRTCALAAWPTPAQKCGK